jgi:hypothetical protein
MKAHQYNRDSTGITEMPFNVGNFMYYPGVIFNSTPSGTKEMSSPKNGFKVYPNRFTNRVYFDLQLQTDSKVRLDICDLIGVSLAVVFDNIVIGNAHNLFEYAPGSNVRSGILFYRLIVDGELMFQGKLIRAGE